MWSLPKRFNRTTILILGCVAFLAGLVVARRWAEVSGWMAGVALVWAVVLLRRRTAVAVLAVVLAGLLLGVWRGGAYLQQLQPYQDFARQKVTFTATVHIDAVYGRNAQLSFVVRDVQFESPARLHAPGSIKVSGYGLPMTYRGDRLQITGKLYPTRGANQATISYAQLAKISEGGSPIDTFRRNFAAGMQTALPEPQASFGLGLLVGQRNTLPEALSEALLMVGLTHIIAVSGYNLTILLEAAKRAMGSHSKALSTVAALALIAAFLLVTGAGASIVRAAVISVLGIAAWYYGRTVRPLLLILMAAAGTAYANPVYLWADLSWYLSFLAFFGILLVAPLVTCKVYGQKQPPLIPKMIIETLCAEIMTLPLVLYIFGQVSLVSLAANILVAALIPLAMLLSFIAGLAGMFAGTVAGWFAWPAKLLLTYMLDVVGYLASLPHVFQQNRYISVAEMAVCYAGVVVTVMVAYWTGLRRKGHAYVERAEPITN